MWDLSPTFLLIMQEAHIIKKKFITYFVKQIVLVKNIFFKIEIKYICLFRYYTYTIHVLTI